MIIKYGYSQGYDRRRGAGFIPVYDGRTHDALFYKRATNALKYAELEAKDSARFLLSKKHTFLNVGDVTGCEYVTGQNELAV